MKIRRPYQVMAMVFLMGASFSVRPLLASEYRSIDELAKVLGQPIDISNRAFATAPNRASDPLITQATIRMQRLENEYSIEARIDHGVVTMKVDALYDMTKTSVLSFLQLLAKEPWTNSAENVWTLEHDEGKATWNGGRKLEIILN